MKITVDVNGKPTEINLTQDNIAMVKAFNQPITERIQTWEDVCAINGDDPKAILPYQSPSNDFEQWVNDVVMVAKTIHAYAEGWVGDYSNGNQEKWFLRYYWDDKKSGFGFSYSSPVLR